MKRWYVLIISIVMMMIIGCGLKSPTSNISAPAVYSNYQDIPGVTLEEIEAIEDLKAQYDEFTIGLLPSTEAFYWEDGDIGGFSPLFCQWMSELFCVEFTPDIYQWEQLVSHLSEYEVDFGMDITRTPERLSQYFMTDPIANRSIGYFQIEGSSDLETLSKQRPLNLVFISGTVSYDYVKENLGQEFNAYFLDNYDQVIDFLRSGQADALCLDSTTEYALEEYGDIVYRDFFPPIYTSVSLSTCNPVLEPFISVVQKYLDQGAFYHLSNLYNEGYKQYLANKLRGMLTDEEIQYLDTHVQEGITIPYGAQNDNYPISFYNHRDKEWQGISIDLLQEISQLTGLTFEPYNAPDEGWGRLMDLLNSGEISLITNLIATEERIGNYLWPNQPVMTDYYALVSLMDREEITLNQISYYRIAVLEQSAYEEVFVNWFPEHPNLIRYSNTVDAFGALETGDADFVMATRNQMLSMTNFYEKPYYKLNYVFDYGFDYTLAFHRDEEILCSIVSKAQSLLEVENISNLWTRKVFDYSAQIAKARIPWLLVVVGLLVVVLILVLIMFQRWRKFSVELEQLVKERTKELEIQTQAAWVASQAKTEFLSTMSHEIRTPLNAIIGMAQAAGQSSGNQIKEYLQQILSASDHLLGVLNDILDMSKIEVDKFQLELHPFSLRAAADEVIQIIEPQYKRHKVTFKSNYDAIPELNVKGDCRRLKQILINLLSNAIKFSRPGGTVCFNIEISQQEGADQFVVSFRVKDNGIGMDEENIKRAFLPFERVHDKTAIQYGGTGMGLPISQRLVNMMGGEILLESQPGEGTECSFSLVMERVQLPDDLAEKSLALPCLSNKRILLAEDVELNRMVVGALLMDTGVAIEEAVDGREAVELFRKSISGYYDLIFMDIQMPYLSGYQATQEIRCSNHPDARSIPIVAMTANAYPEDIEKAFASGMNGHISKPVDLQVIYKVLREIFVRE